MLATRQLMVAIDLHSMLPTVDCVDNNILQNIFLVISLTNWGSLNYDKYDRFDKYILKYTFDDLFSMAKGKKIHV